jgi:phosphatidylserine decarboxylase
MIAREGHGLLLLVAVCAALLHAFLGFYAAIPAWGLLGLLFYQFRDPTQTPPSLPLAIVSPIHGRITASGPTRDPWLKRDSESVAVTTGIFDIRSIYAPIEGKIVEQWTTIPDPEPGEGCPKHSNAFHIRTDERDDIVLVITRGEWGGNVSIAYNPGERIGQGRRIGYANFGCSARLYLPAGSQLAVAAGDKVAAGSSIVAMLVHLTRMSLPRDADAATTNPAASVIDRSVTDEA